MDSHWGIINSASAFSLLATMEQRRWRLVQHRSEVLSIRTADHMFGNSFADLFQDSSHRLVQGRLKLDTRESKGEGLYSLLFGIELSCIFSAF